MEDRDRAPGAARGEVVSKPPLLVGAGAATTSEWPAVPVEHDDVPRAQAVREPGSSLPGGRAAQVFLQRRATVRVDVVVARGREPDPVLDRPPRSAEAVVEVLGCPILVGGIAEDRDRTRKPAHQRARRVVVGRVATTDVASRQEHCRLIGPRARSGCGASRRHRRSRRPGSSGASTRNARGGDHEGCDRKPSSAAGGTSVHGDLRPRGCGNTKHVTARLGCATMRTGRSGP